MTRVFKGPGLVLLAVFLFAVSASPASALKFTASTYPTVGTAESALGNDAFTTEAGKIECKSHFEGSIAAAQSTLTVKATYTKCQAFGFISATVSMNSCVFEFTSPTETAADTFSGAAHVRCSGEPALLVAGTCKATVGEQSPGGSVSGTDNTATGDASVQANVNEINYTVTQDGIGCPFEGTGPKTGATYVQAQPVTVQATNGATIDVG
jgi:hypothetical protein